MEYIFHSLYVFIVEKWRFCGLLFSQRSKCLIIPAIQTIQLVRFFPTYNFLLKAIYINFYFLEFLSRRIDRGSVHDALKEERKYDKIHRK